MRVNYKTAKRVHTEVFLSARMNGDLASSSWTMIGKGKRWEWYSLNGNGRSYIKCLWVRIKLAAGKGCAYKACVFVLLKETINVHYLTFPKTDVVKKKEERKKKGT